MGTENLRHEVRVDASVPVVLIRGRTEARLETTDVSYRGLFVQTAEAPPLRSLVRLRIELPTGSVEAHAMVVHVVAGKATHAEGVGLQFWGLSGLERRAWEDFVRSVIDARRAAMRPKPVPRTARVAGAADSPPSGIRTIASPDASVAPPLVGTDAHRGGTRR